MKSLLLLLGMLAVACNQTTSISNSMSTVDGDSTIELTSVEYDLALEIYRDGELVDSRLVPVKAAALSNAIVDLDLASLPEWTELDNHLSQIEIKDYVPSYTSSHLNVLPGTYQFMMLADSDALFLVAPLNSLSTLANYTDPSLVRLNGTIVVGSTGHITKISNQDQIKGTDSSIDDLTSLIISDSESFGLIKSTQKKPLPKKPFRFDDVNKKSLEKSRSSTSTRTSTSSSTETRPASNTEHHSVQVKEKSPIALLLHFDFMPKFVNYVTVHGEGYINARAEGPTILDFLKKDPKQFAKEQNNIAKKMFLTMQVLESLNFALPKNFGLDSFVLTRVDKETSVVLKDPNSLIKLPADKNWRAPSKNRDQVELNHKLAKLKILIQLHELSGKPLSNLFSFPINGLGLATTTTNSAEGTLVRPVSSSTEAQRVRLTNNGRSLTESELQRLTRTSSMQSFIQLSSRESTTSPDKQVTDYVKNHLANGTNELAQYLNRPIHQKGVYFDLAENRCYVPMRSDEGGKQNWVWVLFDTKTGLRVGSPTIVYGASFTTTVEVSATFSRSDVTLLRTPADVDRFIRDPQLLPSLVFTPQQIQNPDF